MGEPTLVKWSHQTTGKPHTTYRQGHFSNVGAPILPKVSSPILPKSVHHDYLTIHYLLADFSYVGWPIYL